MTDGHRGTAAALQARETDARRLDEAKHRLRAASKRRRALAARQAPRAGAAISARVLAEIPMPHGAALSVYWPKGDELDPRPLMTALHELGHEIGLPIVVARATALLFRRWAPGDLLQPAGFGLLVPGADQPEVTPRVVFAPLLAFDRAGYRLGYGGGFYDRTLAWLGARGTVLAVGLAYAGQETATLPRAPTDRRLDWIVTETETVRLG